MQAIHALPAVPCYAMLCHAMMLGYGAIVAFFCYAVVLLSIKRSRHCVMLCCAMRCYSTLRCAMLCYVRCTIVSMRVYVYVWMAGWMEGCVWV